MLRFLVPVAMLFSLGFHCICYAVETPYVKSCNKATVKSCGEWEVPAESSVCAPSGAAATCVSSTTGGTCVDAQYWNYCWDSAYCEGFCENHPTEQCFGGDLYC